MRVEGAVGFVTGGASGLGRGVVETLVAHGGRAVIADLPSSAGQELAEKLGKDAHFVACNVTDEASVEAAVADALGAFGRLDVLVSCAGISIGARTIARDGTMIPLDLFRRHIDVNLVGLFDVVRHVAAAMAKNEPSNEGERGLIVNIASIAGIEGQAGQCAYTASKGGVVALTLPLARDLAPLGIRVMCVCPGTMDTPMLATLPPEDIEKLASNNLFPKRLGTPGDLGALVMAFMDQTFLNGDVVRLDAGLRLAAR